MPGAGGAARRAGDAAQAVHAVHPRLVDEGAEQGTVGAGVDRDCGAGERGQRQRVGAVCSSSPTLPPATVTASTSSSGDASASSSARASSVPGSQSRMMGIGTANSLPVAAQDATLVREAEPAMAMQNIPVATGGGAAADGSQAVMVPLNQRLLVPTPAERVRRIREHLVRSLRECGR